MRKNIIGLIIVALFIVINTAFLTAMASAAVLPGIQGGTGVSSTSAGNVGNCLSVASTSPFLTWTIGTCSGGGLASSSPIYLGGVAYFTDSSTLTTALPMIYNATTGVLTIGSSSIINASTTNLDSQTTSTFPAVRFTSLSSNPQLFANNDPNTGINFPGPDIMQIKTGGFTRMYFDSAGDVVVGSSTSPDDTFSIVSNATKPIFEVYTSSTPPTPVFIVDNNGHIGVGTSTCAFAFCVATTTNIFWANAGTNQINFINASGTSINVTGYGTFPTLNFTNASGTSLGLTGYVYADHASTTNQSSTNATIKNLFDVSGNRYVTSTSGGGITTSTTIFAGGVPFFLENNASSVVQTNTGLLYASTTQTLTISNASTSNVSSTNLTAATIQLSSSTSSKCLRTSANNVIVPAAADCGTGGSASSTPIVLDTNNASLSDANGATPQRATTTATGIASGFAFSALMFPSSTASTSAFWGPFIINQGVWNGEFTQTTSSPVAAANAATFQLSVATTTGTASTSISALVFKSCGVLNIGYNTTTADIVVHKSLTCADTTSTSPILTYFALERMSSGTDEMALIKSFIW